MSHLSQAAPHTPDRSPAAGRIRAAVQVSHLSHASSGTPDHSPVGGGGAAVVQVSQSVSCQPRHARPLTGRRRRRCRRRSGVSSVSCRAPHTRASRRLPTEMAPPIRCLRCLVNSQVGRLTSTLSMRRPSMSTTSKRQPPIRMSPASGSVHLSSKAGQGVKPRSGAPGRQGVFAARRSASAVDQAGAVVALHDAGLVARPARGMLAARSPPARRSRVTSPRSAPYSSTTRPSARRELRSARAPSGRRAYRARPRACLTSRAIGLPPPTSASSTSRTSTHAHDIVGLAFADRQARPLATRRSREDRRAVARGRARRIRRGVMMARTPTVGEAHHAADHVPLAGARRHRSPRPRRSAHGSPLP